MCGDVSPPLGVVLLEWCNLSIECVPCFVPVLPSIEYVPCFVPVMSMCRVVCRASPCYTGGLILRYVPFLTPTRLLMSLHRGTLAAS